MRFTQLRIRRCEIIYIISIVTIKKLCDGLEISIPEFFDDAVFRELEQEIR